MKETNYMTRAGAQVLANRIYAYWAKRNVYPEIWIDNVVMRTEEKNKAQRVYFVRSDLAERMSKAFAP